MGWHGCASVRLKTSWRDGWICTWNGVPRQALERKRRVTAQLAAHLLRSQRSARPPHVSVGRRHSVVSAAVKRCCAPVGKKRCSAGRSCRSHAGRRQAEQVSSICRCSHAGHAPALACPKSACAPAA